MLCAKKEREDIGMSCEGGSDGGVLEVMGQGVDRTKRLVILGRDTVSAQGLGPCESCRQDIAGERWVEFSTC